MLRRRPVLGELLGEVEGSVAQGTVVQALDHRLPLRRGTPRLRLGLGAYADWVVSGREEQLEVHCEQLPERAVRLEASGTEAFGGVELEHCGGEGHPRHFPGRPGRGRRGWAAVQLHPPFVKVYQKLLGQT